MVLLLRAAASIASRAAASLVAAPKPQLAAVGPLGVRRIAMGRSVPRLGHNLEDHFDMAEYVCRMHCPSGEYFIWGCMLSMILFTFGPLLHSNYYFTGRIMPKDQGNTQLC